MEATSFLNMLTTCLWLLDWRELTCSFRNFLKCISATHFWEAWCLAGFKSCTIRLTWLSVFLAREYAFRLIRLGAASWLRSCLALALCLFMSTIISVLTWKLLMPSWLVWISLQCIAIIFSTVFNSYVTKAVSPWLIELRRREGTWNSVPSRLMRRPLCSKSASCRLLHDLMSL